MTTSACWPNDPDYLDGRTEVRLPSPALLRAYWDADILDVNGVQPGTIIDVKDSFDVRFRLELSGALWLCVAGTWVFDMGFTSIGKGGSFDLSDLLPAGVLNKANWKGCDPGALCIEVRYTVPPGTIPAELADGTLYETGATFQLHCCDKGARVVGYEALEEYMFYDA